MKPGHAISLLTMLLLVGVSGAACADCSGGISDDFGDGALAPRWVVTSLPCGSIAELGGQLVLQRGACTGTIAVEMTALNEELCGDFDVQVGYTLSGFGVPGNGSMWASMLLFESQGSGYCAVERYNRFAAGDCAPSTQDYKMFVNTTANCSSYLEATADQSGALRIRRSGSTVEFYRLATTWVLMASSTFSTTPVRLRFYTGSDVSTASWTFTLDNLTITSEPVGVASSSSPETNGFVRAAPNPFCDHTTLEYSMARPGRVDLAIYAIDGRHIRTLATGDRTAALHQVVWDGRDDAGRKVSSGVYFVRLGTEVGTLGHRILLAR